MTIINYKLFDDDRKRNAGQCNSRETGLIKNFDWMYTNM